MYVGNSVTMYFLSVFPRIKSNAYRNVGYCIT